MRDIVNLDGEVARMSLDLPISFDADLVSIEETLKEELPKLTEVIPGLVKPPVYEGVDSFRDSNVILKLAIYVKTEARIPALRALNREVKLIFDRRGIELPLNQIVVHEAKRTHSDS
jgi:small conductance mechanosensitive channel